jgi:hypothetical protein
MRTVYLAIAEIFGIFVGVAEIIVDEDGGLAGKFEALAALVAGDEIIEANHEGSGFNEFAAIFFAGAARQFFFLATDFPAHGGFEFTAAAWTDQLNLARLFLLGVKSPFVHYASTTFP